MQEAASMLRELASLNILRGRYNRNKCLHVCRELTIRKKCGCAEELYPVLMHSPGLMASDQPISLCQELASEWQVPGTNGRLDECLGGLKAAGGVVEFCNEACPVACAKKTFATEVTTVDSPALMHINVLGLAHKQVGCGCTMASRFILI